MRSAGSILERPPVDGELLTDSEWVHRFGRTERFLHWWTVAMAAAALLTGLGVGDDRSGPMLVAHVTAVVLVGVGILAALVVGDRRALLRAARELFRFDRRDLAWLRELRRRPLHYPSGTDCGMFNPGQKLLAWALPFVAVAVIGTGIASAVGGSLGGLHGATAVVALALLGAHVFMAVVNPITRHALNGMVFGRVRRSWAAHHHGAWLGEMDAATRIRGVTEAPAPPLRSNGHGPDVHRRGRFLAFGFDVDPLGNRRRPVLRNVVVLAIVLPALSVWAIFRIFTTATGPGLWALAFGLYMFTLFGVTLGNHRYWTHRGFKAREPLRWVMAIASGMSVQGTIEQWTLAHRAHHRYADVIGVDPHSPYEYREWRGLKGLAWAQGVWLLFENPFWSQFQTQPDLTEDRIVQWEKKAFPFLAVGQFGLLLAFYPLFGWNAILIAGGLRVTALLTTTGMVNSVCHRWGTRARDSRGHEYRSDDSRNNVFVALLTGGEGNHSWHHADPACPRHGRKVALDPEAVRAGAKRDHGWRPDATWRLIQILAAVRLVYDLKPVRTTVYFGDKQRTPNPSLIATHRQWHIT